MATKRTVLSPQGEVRMDVDGGELQALGTEVLQCECSLTQMVRDLEELRCPSTGQRADECARCVSGAENHFPGGVKRHFVELFGQMRVLLDCLRRLIGTTIASQSCRKVG